MRSNQHESRWAALCQLPVIGIENQPAQWVFILGRLHHQVRANFPDLSEYSLVERTVARCTHADLDIRGENGDLQLPQVGEVVRQGDVPGFFRLLERIRMA